MRARADRSPQFFNRHRPDSSSNSSSSSTSLRPGGYQPRGPMGIRLCFDHNPPLFLPSKIEDEDEFEDDNNCGILTGRLSVARPTEDRRLLRETSAQSGAWKPRLQMKPL